MAVVGATQLFVVITARVARGVPRLRAPVARRLLVRPLRRAEEALLPLRLAPDLALRPLLPIEAVTGPRPRQR